MIVELTLFDFDAAQRQEAEAYYLNTYVGGMAQMPALHRYLIGPLRPTDDQPPPFHRAAVRLWNSVDDFRHSIAYGAEEKAGLRPLRQWAARVQDYVADAVEIPDLTNSQPFYPDRSRGLLSIWLFSFLPVASFEECQRYYIEAYAPHIRKMPGLRTYLVGRTLAMGRDEPRFSRLSILEIDPAEQARRGALVPPSGPPWVRPMEEWCSAITNYVVDFTEVPLPLR